MLPPELVVIADGYRRSSLPRVIRLSSAAIVDPHDTEALSSINAPVVLIDVDLHDVATVKLIKDSVPSRSGPQFRIVAVERASHRCEVQANGLGASDLLRRPWSIDDLHHCLRRYADEHAATPPSDPLVEALSREPGGTSIISAARELDRLFTGLISDGPLNFTMVAQTSDEILHAVANVGLAAWLDTVRRYHEGTFQHCLLVTGAITAFGHKTGMRRADIMTLTLAGLLHDVGKARIPVNILDKPGHLTDEEFAVIKTHPAIGYDYLKAQNEVSTDVLDAVRHHHEYLDGSGYPDGLAAKRIGDLTRIMTICDIYGALLERRAYKAPKSPEAAIQILTDMAGKGRVELSLVNALRASVAG